MAAVKLKVVKSGDAVDDLIVGASQQMVRIRDLVRRVARSDASVMITGPSGSGKEVVAKAIHEASARSHKPFVAINCGAIPPELIESELFGHERGSFTGAHARRIGRFEEADGGTLFLDEIGDMRFDMQVKLLRVLEDRMVTRIGGSETNKVNVRVICATHQNIQEAIAENRFRQDLFFRLGVLPVRLPSLNDRVEDLALLIQHFQRMDGSQPQPIFSASAIARLQRHDWVGNVRELRNVIERAQVLYGSDVIDHRDVDQLVGQCDNFAQAVTDQVNAQPANDEVSLSDWISETPIDLKAVLEDLELQRIQMALSRADGVIAEAARLLTLKRTTLIEKMRKYELTRA